MSRKNNEECVVDPEKLEGFIDDRPDFELIVALKSCVLPVIVVFGLVVAVFTSIVYVHSNMESIVSWLFGVYNNLVFPNIGESFEIWPLILTWSIMGVSAILGCIDAKYKLPISKEAVSRIFIALGVLFCLSMLPLVMMVWHQWEAMYYTAPFFVIPCIILWLFVMMVLL